MPKTLDHGMLKVLTLESISFQLRMVVTSRSKDLEMILPGALRISVEKLRTISWRITQDFVNTELMTIQITVVRYSS